jgi:hypothetical protein
MQHTLLGTVYFISLFFPFDTTAEALKAAIARWLKLRGRGEVVPPKGKAALDFVFVDEVKTLGLGFTAFRDISPLFLINSPSSLSLMCVRACVCVCALLSVASSSRVRYGVCVCVCGVQCLRMLAPGYLEASENFVSLIKQCSDIAFPDDFVADSAPVGLRAPLSLSLSLHGFGVARHRALVLS